MRDRCSGIDVEKLQELRVFPHIHAIPVGAFAGDGPGIAHTVPVVGLRPVPGLLRGGAIFRSQMPDDHADPDPVEQAELLRRCGEFSNVVDETDDGGDAEIGHQLHLVHAARFDAGPCGQKDRVGELGHRLADVMSAIDHAVAVNRVNDIVRFQPHPAIHSPHQKIADLAPLWPEHQHLRLARRSRRGVEYRRGAGLRIVGEAMKISVGRMFRDRGHQVRLVVHGQLADIGQPADVARLDPLRAPQTLIERDFPSPSHQLAELVVLQRMKLVAAHVPVPCDECIADRIVHQHRLGVESLEIGRIRHLGSTK